MQTVEEVLLVNPALMHYPLVNSKVAVLVHGKNPVSAICKYSINFVVHQLFVKIVSYIVSPFQLLSVLVV